MYIYNSCDIELAWLEENNPDEKFKLSIVDTHPVYIRNSISHDLF